MSSMKAGVIKRPHVVIIPIVALNTIVPLHQATATENPYVDFDRNSVPVYGNQCVDVMAIHTSTNVLLPKMAWVYPIAGNVVLNLVLMVLVLKASTASKTIVKEKENVLRFPKSAH